MRAFFLCGVLLLTGCFTRVEIRHTQMVVIPVPERPDLTGDAESDLLLLGSHAMRLRRLIAAYNEMAAEHNRLHGY